MHDCIAEYMDGRESRACSDLKPVVLHFYYYEFRIFAFVLHLRISRGICHHFELLLQPF